MENASNYQLTSIRFDALDANKVTVELLDRGLGSACPVTVDISLLRQAEEMITLRDIRLIAAATVAKERCRHDAAGLGMPWSCKNCQH